MDQDCKHPDTEIYDVPNLGVRACHLCGKVIGEHLRVEAFVGQPSGSGAPRFRPAHRSLSVTDATRSGELSKACMESVRRELVNLSHRVRTSETVVNTAQRLYSMLVDRGMNTAFERRITLGVCLYIACRLERTNHIISQFVHAVGTTIGNFNALFIRISHALELGMHTVSSETYLESLIEHLNLGDAAPEVTTRAEEILQKMHEEWIDYGRFPFGVVAAAVLIACQMTGHTHSVETLSEMVMMSSSTLLRRLQEFSQSNLLTTNGDGDDSKAPPIYLKQKDTEYLVKRLNGYHLRLREMRQTILEMFAGFSDHRTPLCLSTWKSYWNKRSVAAALCLQITKRSDLAGSDVSFNVLQAELRNFGSPVYLPVETPELDDSAVNTILQEIKMHDSGADVSFIKEQTTSVVSVNRKLSPLISQADERTTSSNTFISVIDEEAPSDTGIVWQMVSLEHSDLRDQIVDSTKSESGLTQRSNRTDIFPEIEYIEVNVNHRLAYIHEVLEQRERKKARSVNGSERQLQALVSQLSGESSNASTTRSISSCSLSSSVTSSRRKRTTVSKNAESPGQSLISQFKRRATGGFDQDAILELLDGRSEGIDVPSWNESVIDVKNILPTENEPLSS